MRWLCFRTKKPSSNKESTAAANAFCNETGIKGNTAIIRADPDVPKNQEFWRQYLAETKLSEALIILITSSGQIAGIYRGKATKEELLEGLTSALSSGCGCGS